MTKAPAFIKGRGFMTKKLSVPEVEFVGPIVAEELRRCAKAIVENSFDPEEVFDEEQKAKRVFAILKKLDWPAPDRFWGEDANVDAAYRRLKEKFCA